MKSALTVVVLLVSSFPERAAHADDVIEDPELASVPHETLVAAPPANGPKDTTWRATLHTRWGVDTDWTRPSQDIVEGTTVATLEAEQRRSDSLLLSVGVRARHGFAVHRSGGARYALDVTPLSLFADVTPGAGYHVRVGYQTITMGRFDLFSATNFLAVYDLRSGPVTMTEASPIATPALRFDFDKLRGFTLQAFYQPFFVPHLVDGYGTNYALLSALDRQHLASADASREALQRALGRSGLTTTSTDVLQALGPAPDLREPQGAIRATVYGSAGELSATVGTALEPLPTLLPNPTLVSLLENPAAMLSADQQNALGDRPIRVSHARYEVASMDGALDAGPLQLGAEAAYLRHRTLLGTRPATGLSGLKAESEQVDLAQFGLRGEYVQGAEWAVVLETFLAMALRNPTDPTLAWYGFDGRYQYGVALGAHFTPEKSRLRFELGGGALAVATYLIMPRVEWEALNAFFLELGGVFVEGRAPGALFSHNTSFGGLYTDVDQVFVGARWTP